MASEPIEVLPCDREAAADLWNDLGYRRRNPPARYAEAFARHRQSAMPGRVDREAAARLIYSWSPCIHDTRTAALLETGKYGTFAFASWEEVADSVKAEIYARVDALAATPPAPGEGAVEFGEHGQDRKFAFRNGQFVNRVSGEAIPLDEPIIIFRARDVRALPVLRFYLSICEDEHHRQAIQNRVDEFSAYTLTHADRMKEPGITRAIRLNDASAAEAESKPEPMLTNEIGGAAPLAMEGKRRRSSAEAESKPAAMDGEGRQND